MRKTSLPAYPLPTSTSRAHAPLWASSQPPWPDSHEETDVPDRTGVNPFWSRYTPAIGQSPFVHIIQDILQKYVTCEASADSVRLMSPTAEPRLYDSVYPFVATFLREVKGRTNFFRFLREQIGEDPNAYAYESTHLRPGVIQDSHWPHPPESKPAVRLEHRKRVPTSYQDLSVEELVNQAPDLSEVWQQVVSGIRILHAAGVKEATRSLPVSVGGTKGDDGTNQLIIVRSSFGVLTLRFPKSS